VTTFDLRGQPAGIRDVTVAFTDSSTKSFPASFEIVDGGGGIPVLELVGPAAVRAGRDATFVGYLRNVGLNDIGPASYEFATDAASVAHLAAMSTVGGTLDSTAPGSWSSASGVFRFSSCGNLVFRLLDLQQADNCGSWRRLIRKLKVKINDLQTQISKLRKKFDDLGCGGPNRGTPECLAIIAEIDQLDAALQDAVADRRAAEAGLRQCLRGHQGNTSVVPLRGTLADLGQTQITVCPVFSWDPNDKVGLTGVGTDRYLQAKLPIPYTIYFENKATATAPAQDVFVTDVLDSNLDLSTFTLGAIRFGDHVVDVPEGLQQFVTIEDLRPATNLLVRIEAKLDAASRKATWQFTSLDPVTGQPTTDPFAGFLPPNWNPPQGEGSVSFTISPRSDLRTNDVVQNGATIVFDANAPIFTPVWSNAFDMDLPESQVFSLPPTQSAATFDVGWSGTDAGSGIESYSIYFTDNGGPLTAFVLDTAGSGGQFTGQFGHTYRFYSISRDVAGNVETLGLAPDAVTTILADTKPPSISVSVNPSTLWPPNGKNVPVNVSGVISDQESGIDPASVTFSVVDEYGSYQPTGSVVLAADGSFAFIVPIEAARRGNDMDGRLYTIAVRVRDIAGNQSSSSTTVIVPHDRR
jgi:uncharacterized repeat protein (TIGR01451 family)